MSRETKAQRDRRIGDLLAEYDNVTRQLRKYEADQKALKKLVDEIEPGTYGEWVRSHGTPRMIPDMDAIHEDYAARKVEVPRKATKAPIVVQHVASAK